MFVTQAARIVHCMPASIRGMPEGIKPLPALCCQSRGAAQVNLRNSIAIWQEHAHNRTGRTPPMGGNMWGVSCCMHVFPKTPQRRQSVRPPGVTPNIETMTANNRGGEAEQREADSQGRGNSAKLTQTSGGSSETLTPPVFTGRSPLEEDAHLRLERTSSR